MAKRKLSPREFASENGTTLQAVYQRIWAGRLPVVKVEGRWQILVDEPKDKEQQAR